MSSLCSIALGSVYPPKYRSNNIFVQVDVFPVLSNSLITNHGITPASTMLIISVQLRQPTRNQTLPRLNRAPKVTSQVSYISGILSNLDVNGNKNVKKAIGLIPKHNNLHHTFGTLFFVTARLRRETSWCNVLWTM